MGEWERERDEVDADVVGEREMVEEEEDALILPLAFQIQILETTTGREKER